MYPTSCRHREKLGKGNERHVTLPVGSGRVRAPATLYAASWKASGSPDIDRVRAWALQWVLAGSNPDSMAD